MTGREIYQRICEQPDIDAAVSRLPCGHLATLAEYLAKLRPAGGVPSQVWGVVSAKLTAKPEGKKRR